MKPFANPLGMIFRKRTRYQDIQLRGDRRGLFLTLNGSPQVHSSEERPYHEAIATVPMLLARHTARVAILGGGDGLAARNVLDFPDVDSCTLVELDPGMIELCARDPRWRRLTHGSLTDRRLEVVVGDALGWMARARGRFDVIIHDVEISFTKQPKQLSVERCFAFFMDTYRKLAPGGIWVLTVADDTPQTLVDGAFSWLGDRLSDSARRRYPRLRGAIPKVRLLLDEIFPHVRELTISPPVLGTHTTFYTSNAPIGGFRRRPPFPLSLPRAERDLSGSSR